MRLILWDFSVRGRKQCGTRAANCRNIRQVAMAKFNYKKQQRAITHKLSKQEL